MNDELTHNPEREATAVVAAAAVTPEPVTSGPVTSGTAAAIAPHPRQAIWARIGLLGIGAAAILAAAILGLGFSASPTGTLAAGSQSDGDSSVVNLNGGGPGFAFGRGGHGFGAIEITAISGNSISLATKDGWTRTITVDGGTTYAKGGSDIALGDLAVGDTIGFRQTLEDDGTWTIDSIAVILPHVGGEVTAVSGSTITVERRDGTSGTINVDGDTTFQVNGDTAALADVEVGMFLVAEGEQAGDDAINATRVVAGDERGRGGHGFRFGGPGPDDRNPDATTAPEASGSAS